MRSTLTKFLSILLLSGSMFGQGLVNIDMNVKGSRFFWGTDSGSSNAYVVTTIAPLGPSLRTGSRFAFVVAHTNTSSSTLNVDSTGVLNVKKWSSGSLVNLAAGDWTANQVVEVIYDGTQYQWTAGGMLAGSAHAIEAALICSDSSGSGTAQSCSTSPTFTPVSGDTILYTTTTSNTGDLTINVNSLGAKHVRKWLGSSVLASGDLPANTPEFLTYDGTYWEAYTIGNPPSASGSTTVNGQTCTIGGSCNVNNGAATHSVAINEGAGAAIAGVALGAHQTLIGASSADPSAQTVPDCQDSGGNHLNFTQSTDAFSCGTTAGSSSGGTLTVIISNDGSTGTGTNLLTKTSSGNAIKMTTSDTGPSTSYVGICTSGCGTSGNATITYSGRVQCQFDGNTTQGDAAIVSVTTTGNCHDVAAKSVADCTTTRGIGTIVDTGSGTGLRNIDLNQVPPCRDMTAAAFGKFIPYLVNATGTGNNQSYQFGTSNLTLSSATKDADVGVNSANGKGGMRFYSPGSNSNTYNMIVNCGTGNTCGANNFDWKFDVQSQGINTGNGGWDMIRFVGATYSVLYDYGTFSGSQTIQTMIADTIKFTMSGNTTISFATSSANKDNAGHKLVIIACQDGTGGWALTMPANVKHAPTWTTTLSDCTAAEFTYDGTNYWHNQ